MSDAAYTIETYDSREAWLQARKRGIGGSDSACVVGMGRFRSAYSVATDKLTTAIDSEDGDEMREWGRRLEPAIAFKFDQVMRRRGEPFDVVDLGDYTICRSIERPHIFCTPDRLLYRDGKLVGEASLKCVFNYDSAKEWANAVPLSHQIQNQHTMYVLGIDQSYFAALLLGYNFKWHSIRRNERWLSRMLPRLDAFWESIQRGEYPKVDESEATARALAVRYPSPTAGHVELPADLTELGDEYDEILANEREIAKRKTLIQNIAKESIGEGTVGVLSDGTGFKWAANGRGSRTFKRVKKVRDVDG